MLYFEYIFYKCRVYSESIIQNVSRPTHKIIQPATLASRGDLNISFLLVTKRQHPKFLQLCKILDFILFRGAGFYFLAQENVHRILLKFH